MNLSLPFIRRPVMTAVLTLSTVLFGLVAYIDLPVNDLPVVDYPVIQVTVGYPGASPETVAHNVATPLERQFLQISGLELVTSRNVQGLATLTLQFALDKDIDAAATDVQTAISQAIPNLPVDLPSPPTFAKTNPNDQPIMYIALTSDAVTAGQLYDYASTQVGQRLSIVKGVSRVQVFGVKSAIRIKADPARMAARRITIEDLAGAIRGGTAYLSAGQLDGPGGTMVLRPEGQLETVRGYDDLIVGGQNGAPIRLRDVAKASDSLVDERLSMHFWARGYPTPKATVIVAVDRQAGANVVNVAQSVREVLPLVETELPGSVRITPIYDRSLSILNSVKDVRETLVIAFVLVIVVIFIFLGRASDTLIPVVALPLSLLITFIAMKALDYTLDNLSLMALTLAIGFLVDDAIVFLENTVRRMEAGEDARTATVKGAEEISFTILSMTLSLAAVFLPLIFMPGIVGRVFREFAVVIVVAIFASGLVSLTLTPLMCARMLSGRGAGYQKTQMEQMMHGLVSFSLRHYGTSLTWFLRHRWISVLIWVLCLVGTLWLFATIPKGFLPPGDSSFVFGAIIGKEGSSPSQMHALQERVETKLKEDEDIVLTFTMTGSGMFGSSNMGIMFFFLKPPAERAPIHEVAGWTMGRLSQVPGAFAFCRPLPVLEISTGATDQLQGQYAYSVSGVNPEQVYEVAGKLMARLKDFPGFASISWDFYHNTPNVDIRIRREKARTYGVSEARILSLLRDAYSQNYVYLIKRPEDQYQVILEVDDESRSRAADLDLLYIKSDDGKNHIPLSNLITWKESIGPQAVNHINQFTSVTLFFNLKAGVPVSDATDFIEKVAADVVPRTVRGGLRGEALTYIQTVRNLTLLMLLAVFVMYVVLAILYESYLHPLTVLSSLPVALVGGLIALHLAQEQATLYAFVGMFMLMGIVKKNGIMIIDFAIQRVAHGEPAEKAIHDASMDRFRPILMTTLAAIAGAVPIALGYGADGESRRPLGMVIVSGLVVSQFITLYITPVLYLYLEEFQEKVLDRTSFFRSSRLAE